MQRTQHNLLLTTLSPVHIGCGEHLEPTSYFVDEGRLYQLDPLAAMSCLTPERKNELIRLCEHAGTGGLVKIQRYLFNQKEDLKAAATAIIPVSDSFEKYYKSKIGLTAKTNETGKLEIERSSHNPHSGSPYIPGSSLKGVMRTALMNKLIGGRRLPASSSNRRETSRDKERKVLFPTGATPNRIEFDPLQALKISDLMPQSDIATQFLFGKNIPRKPPKDSSKKNEGVPIQVETIAPMLVRQFCGDLRLHPTPNCHHIQQHLTLKSLLRYANEFALPQFEDEQRRLEQLHNNCYFNHKVNWLQVTDKLIQTLKPYMESGQIALIRLGKHAGAESKTWDGNRDITILQGKGNKPKFQSHGTTYWLAGYQRDRVDQSLPFGWALLEDADNPVPDELFEEIAALNHGWQNELSEMENELKSLRQQRQVKIKEQAENAEIKAKAEKLRAEELERRKNMSPAELKHEALKEKLENDKRFNIQETTGELRTLLRETVEQAVEGGSSELIEAIKETFSATLAHWGIKRQKNKKLNELWKQLNG